jgi:hypothetical protein
LAFAARKPALAETAAVDADASHLRRDKLFGFASVIILREQKSLSFH